MPCRKLELGVCSGSFELRLRVSASTIIRSRAYAVKYRYQSIHFVKISTLSEDRLYSGLTRRYFLRWCDDVGDLVLHVTVQLNWFELGTGLVLGAYDLLKINWFGTPKHDYSSKALCGLPPTFNLWVVGFARSRFSHETIRPCVADGACVLSW